ncbi:MULTISPECIES: thioesterase family protein [Actinomadura]|uniref:Thioesterase family protein n=1 Tax=Actinomadura litoris TaxID=2678616 RepID=A0A7K1KXT2_9ACTN|nr:MULTISPECIES: thioesterase family protein [Actinomadura]MBT2209180.1 thioesterase family protein [Actinomadura sp. NEAU-AAG7]MUN37011.1 thioesterase family protein [Actinomadura litoris]
MSRFGDSTAVRRVAEGRYETVLDGAFGFADAINGGYLMAILGRAAVEVSPHAHPVSTAATFQRVARPGPAEVIVEPRKVGRTAATSLVTLVQDGRRAVDALITTGTLDGAAEPSWSDTPPLPPLPPLEECADYQPDPGDEGIATQLDMRFDRATMGWLDGRPSGRPEIRAWFRFRDPHEPDALALALAVDALPPVVFNLGVKGWSPTVELTWHLRAVPAPGWLALHGSGRLLSGGWFDEEVEVWDSAGRLVAQSRQIAREGR